MKKFRKLIPALALLLVSAVLMSTASYAWFSMNNKVTVTGMEVKTKVSNNLLISTQTDESTFKTSINQSVKGILEPTSTVNGVNYFYTRANNVNAIGAAVNSSAYVDYATQKAAPGATGYTDKFSEENGVSADSANAIMSGENSAKGYVDYSFYLKVTNTEGSEKEVRLTKMNLLFANQALSSSATVGSSAVNSLAGKAWRTAIFVKNAGTASCATVTDEVVAGNLKTILALEGATYFTSGKAVSATNALGDVSNLNTNAVLFNAPAGNSYWKVTVRLWLEGEDTSCNNTTFAALDQLYTLDLTIEFNNGTAASRITSEVVVP